MPILWLTKDVWRMKSRTDHHIVNIIHLRFQVPPVTSLPANSATIPLRRAMLIAKCALSLSKIWRFVKHSRISCHTILIHIKHHSSLYAFILEVVDPLEVLSHPCRFHAAQEGFELVEHADGTQDAWGADTICSAKIQWVSLSILFSVLVSGSNLWVICASLHGRTKTRGMCGLGTECHRCGGLRINVCY